MPQKTVILLGAVHGRPAIERLLAEFGWTLASTATVNGLARISSRAEVVAVLIDPKTVKLSWRQALAAVRREVPHVSLILCHPFSNPIDWADASAEGAFHLLALPFKLEELRQSLGFVWAHRNKRAKKVVALEEGDHSRAHKARGHVA